MLAQRSFYHYNADSCRKTKLEPHEISIRVGQRNRGFTRANDPEAQCNIYIYICIFPNSDPPSTVALAINDTMLVYLYVLFFFALLVLYMAPSMFL